MDIKEKQAVWLKEKPLFEAELIHSHLLPFFNFNENTGDYEIKVESIPNTDDEDRKVAYETLNTGWAMWKKAINFTEAQVVPESNALLSASLDAIQKLGSGDFILVRKKDFESLGEFKDLYKRAIISAKKRKNQINWAHVAGLGVGSGRAVDLCKSLGIDPGATNMHVVEAQEQRHD